MNKIHFYNIFNLVLWGAGFGLIVTSLGWMAAGGIFLLLWANNLMLALNGRLTGPEWNES